MTAEAAKNLLGECPLCGSKEWWLNGVPLTGFCWGNPEAPHLEVSRLVPVRANPYLPKDTTKDLLTRATMVTVEFPVADDPTSDLEGGMTRVLERARVKLCQKYKRKVELAEWTPRVLPVSRGLRRVLLEVRVWRA